MRATKLTERVRVACAAAAAAGVTATAGGALACNLVEPLWERQRWTVSQDDDSNPPGSAPVISGSTRPPPGTEGCGSGDLDSDPGDCSTIGRVTIVVEESAQDDATPENELAYRVEVVDGSSPFPANEPIIPEKQGDGTYAIWAHISKAKLNARVRLIPVDAGGNEGPPSNTIRLSFDESSCSSQGARSAAGLWPSMLVLLALALRRRGHVQAHDRSPTDSH